jgi:hypothetical protein
MRQVSAKYNATIFAVILTSCDLNMVNYVLNMVNYVTQMSSKHVATMRVPCGKIVKIESCVANMLRYYVASTQVLNWYSATSDLWLLCG